MTPTQPKRCQPARSRRTVSPGLQGKAGSRGRRDGLPLISGGGVGGKAPDPSSTDSERWRLFRFLFGRSKRNIAPGDERSKANDFQPEKQKETRFSHSNIACSAMENRGTAISGPSAAAWGGGWPPKRRLRAPVANRSGRCRHCAMRRRLAIGSLGPASPLDPAQRNTYRVLPPTGFYPAHPAGRGCRSFRCGKRNLIRPTPAKKMYSFTAATKNVSPGLQGKAGSSRW